MRRWATLAALSLATATGGCPRPQVGAPTPVGGEPELRVGLAVGLRDVTIGGDGELFLTDDANGQPIATIPAGVAWNVVADSGALRLVPPGGTPGAPHRGISGVNVTFIVDSTGATRRKVQ